MSEKIQNESLLKKFLSYAVPCIIGMFLTSFITVVDGMFIGWKVGERGLAAVNLTLPILYLLLGLTIMVGVGGVTLAMQSLGERNPARANQRFTFTVKLNAIVNILVIAAVALQLDRVLHLLNAEGEMFTYVKDYLGTMVFFYGFMMMNITLGMFIRSGGRPQLSLLIGIAANGMNILLDYLFVIRLDYGLKGAALATGLSVILAFGLSVFYFLSGKSVFKFAGGSYDPEDLKNILLNGSSEFIGQIAVCITTYLFNLVIIRRIGINGVAAFTIVGYLSLIQYMVLTGIAQGMHPLVSYSYGAKDRESISRLLTVGVKASLLVGAVTFCLSFAATEGIIGIFAHGNRVLIDTAKYGLRIFALTFLINGYNVVASTYFTSLGDAKTSALISVLRSLVLISLFILVLPHFIGETGIWLATPLAEAATFAVSYVCLSKSKAELLSAGNCTGMV